MLFTPAFLFLLPAMDPAFPRLSANQAIAMGLIVPFVGYTSSSAAYCVRRMVAFEVARPLLLASVPMAVAFSFVSLAVPPRWLLLAFGGILFLLASLLIRGRRARPAAGEPTDGLADPSGGPPRRHESRDGRTFIFRFRAGWVERAASAVGGAFVGLTGMGAGAIVTTLLHARHGLPLHLATATSVFVVSVTVMCAALTHALLAFQRHIALPWGLMGTMALAVLLGGQIAPRLARRLPEAILRRALIGTFLVLGVLMLARGAGM